MFERSVVEFQVLTPVADEGLAANVRACLERGLPELRTRPARPCRLTMIANGPSALQAPLTGATLAINGALGLFTDAGLAPTYWIGCDPQALVAGFLTDPPPETTYLVASKCHPDVFEALKGRKVIVWHLDDTGTWDILQHRDPVMCAVSVTIVAFEVMERLGYRGFDAWGWDGCFMDGRANAVFQPISPDRKEVLIDGRSFDTTHTWALEAQDAVNKFRHGCPRVKVHGGGMIAAILDALVPQMRAAA